MIKSMTGYGRARKTLNNRDITVEVKSVNNRYLDCTVKLPRAYIFAEETVKASVQKELSRGKVDIFISIQSVGGEEAVVSVNRELALGYQKAIAEIGDLLQINGDVNALAIAKMPDVLTVTKPEEDIEGITADISAVLQEALASYHTMRAAEGEKLADDIGARLTTIENLTKRVEERSPQTVTEYRERLTAKMQEVLQSSTIEPSRILQEAAIYADKVAVDEETVRLHSHIAQMRKMLQSDDSMGRKMDFLVQEFNRESNTIGSKCNDLSITEVVLALKGEIEKIREQVQNVE